MSTVPAPSIKLSPEQQSEINAYVERQLREVNAKADRITKETREMARRGREAMATGRHRTAAGAQTVVKKAGQAASSLGRLPSRVVERNTSQTGRSDRRKVSGGGRKKRRSKKKKTKRLKRGGGGDAEYLDRLDNTVRDHNALMASLSSSGTPNPSSTEKVKNPVDTTSTPAGASIPADDPINPIDPVDPTDPVEKELEEAREKVSKLSSIAAKKRKNMKIREQDAETLAIDRMRKAWEMKNPKEQTILRRNPSKKITKSRRETKAYDDYLKRMEKGPGPVGKGSVMGRILPPKRGMVGGPDPRRYEGIIESSGGGKRRRKSKRRGSKRRYKLRGGSSKRRSSKRRGSKRRTYKRGGGWIDKYCEKREVKKKEEEARKKEEEAERKREAERIRRLNDEQKKEEEEFWSGTFNSDDPRFDQFSGHNVTLRGGGKRRRKSKRRGSKRRTYKLRGGSSKRRKGSKKRRRGSKKRTKRLR